MLLFGLLPYRAVARPDCREIYRTVQSLQEATSLPVQQSPWKIQLLRDAIIFSTAIALSLLIGYLRRRYKRRHQITAPARYHLADGTRLVDIPDYLDENLIIKVPASKLQDDNRPFLAVRVGPITLITKIYWRIVNY